MYEPNAWSRSKRSVLPAPLSPDTRPTPSLLSLLRSKVEGGVPFDLARRACGVTDAVHDAWTERGLRQHDANPDRVFAKNPERTVIGGSLEPEAEYVRIMSTLQANAAATLVESLWGIARDGTRKRDQLEAIKLLLRGMGEKSFDPRTEQDVQVTAVDDRGAADQAAVDAMTPAERAALREAARMLDAQFAAVEAAASRPLAEPVIDVESVDVEVQST